MVRTHTPWQEHAGSGRGAPAEIDMAAWRRSCRWAKDERNPAWEGARDRDKKKKIFVRSQGYSEGPPRPALRPQRPKALVLPLIRSQATLLGTGAQPSRSGALCSMVRGAATIAGDQTPPSTPKVEGCTCEQMGSAPGVPAERRGQQNMRGSPPKRDYADSGPPRPRP